MIIREWNNYNPEQEAYNNLYRKRRSTYSSENDKDIEKKDLIFQNDIRKNLAKCLKQNKYCILNLDTGLGKTYVTLSFLAKYYRKKTETPILIICPACNISDPWKKELSNYEEDGFSCYIYHGTQKESLATNNTLKLEGFDFIITSYHTIANNNCNEYFKRTLFPIIIFDEPQKIINSTKLNKSLLDLSFIKSYFRLALTASPMSNTIKELFILNAFLKDPSSVEQTYQYVKTASIESIENESKNLPSIISLSKFQKEIQEETKLPSLREYKIKVPLDDRVLEELNKLKYFPQKSRLLVWPSLFLSNIDTPFFNSKIKVLKVILSKIPLKEKVIIFSMYTEGIDSLYVELSNSDYLCFKMTGAMTPKKRKLKVQDFKDYKGKALMLASIKANETGLNYQEANNVIFLDTWYNPQVIKQARDRCFRMGQVKDVNVFYLSSDTEFENNIWDIKDSKLKETNQVLNWEKEVTPIVKDYSNDENYLENISNFLNEIYL